MTHSNYDHWKKNYLQRGSVKKPHGTKNRETLGSKSKAITTPGPKGTREQSSYLERESQAQKVDFKGVWTSDEEHSQPEATKEEGNKYLDLILLQISSLLQELPIGQTQPEAGGHGIDPVYVVHTVQLPWSENRMEKVESKLGGAKSENPAYHLHTI